MTILTPVISIAAGLVLLFAGRKVFWLAAALTAFLFLYNLLRGFLGESAIALVISVIFGMILAGLAIRFVKFVGIIIGGLAGAAGLPLILHLFGVTGSSTVFAVIGAVLGIILVLAAFDLGLVLMTAWIGATMISTNASQLVFKGSTIWAILFIVLLVAGIGTQLSQSGRRIG